MKLKHRVILQLIVLVTFAGLLFVVVKSTTPQA